MDNAMNAVSKVGEDEYGIVTYRFNEFPHYRMVCQFGPNPILDALPDVWTASLTFVERGGEFPIRTDDGALDLFCAPTVEGLVTEMLKRIARYNAECREQLAASGFSAEDIEDIMEN